MKAKVREEIGIFLLGSLLKRYREAGISGREGSREDFDGGRFQRRGDPVMKNLGSGEIPPEGDENRSTNGSKTKRGSRMRNKDFMRCRGGGVLGQEGNFAVYQQR